MSAAGTRLGSGAVAVLELERVVDLGKVAVPGLNLLRVLPCQRLDGAVQLGQVRVLRAHIFAHICRDKCVEAPKKMNEGDVLLNKAS